MFIESKASKRVKLQSESVTQTAQWQTERQIPPDVLMGSCDRSDSDCAGEMKPHTEALIDTAGQQQVQSEWKQHRGQSRARQTSSCSTGASHTEKYLNKNKRFVITGVAVYSWGVASRLGADRVQAAGCSALICSGSGTTLKTLRNYISVFQPDWKCPSCIRLSNKEQ